MQGVNDEEDDDDEHGLRVSVCEGAADGPRRAQDDVDADHVEGLEEVLRCCLLQLRAEADQKHVKEDTEERRSNARVNWAMYSWRV